MSQGFILRRNEGCPTTKVVWDFLVGWLHTHLHEVCSTCSGKRTPQHGWISYTTTQDHKGQMRCVNAADTKTRAPRDIVPVNRVSPTYLEMSANKSNMIVFIMQNHTVASFAICRILPNDHGVLMDIVCARQGSGLGRETMRLVEAYMQRIIKVERLQIYAVWKRVVYFSRMKPGLNYSLGHYHSEDNGRHVDQVRDSLKELLADRRNYGLDWDEVQEHVTELLGFFFKKEFVRLEGVTRGTIQENMPARPAPHDPVELRLRYVAYRYTLLLYNMLRADLCRDRVPRLWRNQQMPTFDDANGYGMVKWLPVVRNKLKRVDGNRFVLVPLDPHASVADHEITRKRVTMQESKDMVPWDMGENVGTVALRDIQPATLLGRYGMFGTVDVAPAQAEDARSHFQLRARISELQVSERDQRELLLHSKRNVHVMLNGLVMDEHVPREFRKFFPYHQMHQRYRLHPTAAINSANTEAEASVAFNGPLVMVKRPVRKGEELKVWYGNDFYFEMMREKCNGEEPMTAEVFDQHLKQHGLVKTLNVCQDRMSVVDNFWN
jgi:hypothetical protein